MRWMNCGDGQGGRMVWPSNSSGEAQLSCGHWSAVDALPSGQQKGWKTRHSTDASCRRQHACIHAAQRLGAAAAGPHLVRGAEHQHMSVPAGRQAGGRRGNRITARAAGAVHFSIKPDQLFSRQQPCWPCCWFATHAGYPKSGLTPTCADCKTTQPQAPMDYAHWDCPNDVWTLTWRSQSGLGKPPRSPPAGRQAGLQAFVNKRQHGAWDTLEEGASVWGAQGGTGWAVHNAPPLSCNLPLGKQAVHCWCRLPLQASNVLPHRNQPHI